jgi:hypothetical protein
MTQKRKVRGGLVRGAHIQYQRSFRITNRMIIIRRQVIWSSILLG